MTGNLGASLRAAAFLAIGLWSVACEGGDESGGSATQPTTVVIAVSDSRIAPAIGETEPSGVFVVVRYVLANGLDEDMRVSQDDFSLVMSDGTVAPRSEPGAEAWEESPRGYDMTETVLLKPGRMPRSWVSVFDVPEGDAAGSWALRYKNEPPVEVPVPSSQ